MSVSVGTLTIDLQASTASFTSEMSKASQLSAKTANDIKRSLEKIAAAGLAMGAAIATGTAALIKGALDIVDETGKLAQSAGTTAETLSVLSYAAKLSGLQIDQLGIGLEKLSKSAFLAQNGNLQLERIFSRLGVTVTDSNGSLKDSGILMEQLASKFAGVADGAGKTALATALFGKSGAALIPFLDQYGSSQARVNAEAHQFGLEISTSTTQLASKAKENLAGLQEVLKGIGFTALGATLPALNNLSGKLLQVARDANIPDLAKSFGEKVTTAVNLLGEGLDFAAKHAHALKVALESLAGLKLAAIAIPIIGDLAEGDIAKIGKGLDKATLSLLGLERVLPALAKFGAWAKETAQFVGLLASEEGIASAAGYVFGGVFAAITGPVGLAIGAISGLGIALFKFRDSTFTLKGTTYELRDVWSAAWKIMKDVLGAVGSAFSDIVAGMKKVWSGFVDLIGASPILAGIKMGFGEAFDWLKQQIGNLVPQYAIDKLNEAKRKREAVIDPRFLQLMPPLPQHHNPQTLNTSGLGLPKRDPYGEEIKQLDLAIAAQKAYLSVLDAAPERIAAIMAKEKADAIILETTNKLIADGTLRKGQSMAASEQAAIREKVATGESLKALVDYGKEIVSQQHSADLSIQQARALAAANLQGEEAIRRVTVANAVLALKHQGSELGVDPSKMAPELAKLRAELTAKSDIDVVGGANRQIDQLRDQLAQRQLLTSATLGSIDALRQADLAEKTFSLDQQIADMGAGEAKNALIAQRQALVNLTEAQWDANDAQSALALLSPVDQYSREMDSLNHAVDALRGLQGGMLSYGEQLQIAARQQDEFNKATDATVALMLREGSAADGVKAFFLEMEKQGKSAASVLYDAFNSAFGKISEGLTGIITAKNRWGRREAVGQFGTMFEDLGKQLLNTSIQKGMQQGLGALGKTFGINLTGIGSKRDGSTPQQALWVQMAGMAGVGQSAASKFVSSGNELDHLESGGSGGNESVSTLPSFFHIPNKFGAPTAPVAASVSSGTNELEDLFGAPSKPGFIPSIASEPVTARTHAGEFPSVFGSTPRGQQSIFGGILSGFARLSGAKQGMERSGGVFGGETLGLPTSLFIAGSTAAVPAGRNELDNLLTPSQGRLRALAPPALQAIPALLRPSGEGVSGSSGDEDSVSAPSAPTPSLQAIPQLLFPSISANPPQASANGLNASPAPVTPITNAPELQPVIYTQITKPQPSIFDQILQSGIGFASKLFGALAFADGGPVSGPGSSTSDSIPARLSRGEFVTKATQTSKYLPLLQRINSDTLKFAMGGPVGFDDGGFVAPSSAYMPAERGLGMLTNASSQITNNASTQRMFSNSGGDTHTWNIDARGSNDPAQITAHMDRYMRTAAPQIAAMSLHVMKDQQLRRAPSAR